MKPKAECSLPWPCLLFVCHLASPNAEKSAQHRMRKASAEYSCLSAHRESADKDLFTACEPNVLEQSESLVLPPRGQKRNLSCSRQDLRPSRFHAVRKHFDLGEGVIFPAPATEKSPLPSTPRSFRRLESVPALNPLGSILGWRSKRLRTRKDAPATLMKATGSGPLL